MRKVAITLGLSLLGLTLLVGFAVVSPRWAEPLASPLRNGLIRVVAAAISLTLDGKLQIGSLEGSLLRNPSFIGVALTDSDGKIVASLDVLRLHYSLGGLPKGRLHIRAVDIVRPVLNLVEEADGRLNVERVLALQPEPEPSEPIPLAFKLDQLVLRDGRIGLHLPDVPGTRVIGNIALELSGQFEPEGVQVHLQQFTARAEPSNVVIKALRGNLSQTARALRFDDWLLETGESRVTLSGTFPIDMFTSESPPARSQPSEERNSRAPAPPSSELMLALDPLGVAEIGRLLGDLSLRGELGGNIVATRRDDELAIKGHLSAGAGRLELDANISPEITPTRYEAKLTVRDLDVSALVDRAALKSDLNLRVQVNGEGFAPADRSGRLALEVKRSYLGAMTLQPSQIRLQVNAKRFEVDVFDLNTSIVKANVKGQVDLDGNSDLTYALSLEPADLRELISVDALGGHIALTGQVQGLWPKVRTSGVMTGKDLRYDETRLHTLELTYQASGLSEHPAATARLQAGHLALGGVAIAELAVQSRYAYENDAHRVHFVVNTDQSSQLYATIEGTLSANDERQTLTVSTLEARVEDHTWRATTPLIAARSTEEIRLQPFRLAHDRESIELAGAVVGDRLDNVRLRIKDLDLTFLRRALALPPLVAGRADWQTEVSGVLRAPILKSTVALRSVDDEQVPLEGANASVNYANNRLDGSLSVVQKGKQTVSLRAALPLDLGLVAKPIEQRLLDQPLQLGLEIGRPNMAILNDALPDVSAVSGTLEARLEIRGTYDRLSIDGDAALHNLGIEGTARQLNGPMHLAATIVTAPSMKALHGTIAKNEVTIAVPELTLRVPSFTGQLAGAETVTPLAVRDVAAEISATWHSGTLREASTRLQAHAEVAALPPMDFALKGRLESEQLTIERINLKSPASELDGAGEISVRDRSVQFSLSIPSLQLSEFEGLVPPEIPSDLGGTIDLSGTLDTPELAARLHYAGARITAGASARLRERHQPYRASLRISSLDVAQFSRQLGGALSATLEVEGSELTTPDAEARVSLDVQSKDFTPTPGLAARVRSRITGSTASIDLFDVTSEPIELNVRGTFSTSQPSDLRYSLAVHDLTPLAERLQVALQAKGELKGRVIGDFDALRTQSRLQLNEWRYGAWQGNRLGASVDGKTLTTKPTVTFQANVTDLQGPQVPSTAIKLGGHFAKENGDFSVEVTDGPFRRSKIAGALSTVPHLHARIDPLRVQTEHWTWTNAKPMEVLYDAQQKLTVSDLELNNAAQRITARGTLSPQGEISANLRIRDLQIKPAIIAFAPAAPIPEGTLTLRLDAGGSVDQPRLDGALRIARLKWAEKSLGDVRAEMTSKDETLSGNAKWIDRGAELLALDGTLVRGATRSLALDVKAPDFNLARLQAISPAIQQCEGQLRIDVRLRGTLDNPTANGVVEVKNGRLLHSTIGEPYTDIQTRAVFRGHRLDIERAEIGSSTGMARLKGWLETNGLALTRANLTLEANEFTAVRTEALETVVSSNIAVRGSQNDLMAAGKINIPQARIRYENLPATGPAAVEPWELTVEGVYGAGPAVATFGSAEAAAVAGKPGDPLSFLRADIQLDMPRNVWIQGSGTAVELGGTLRVKKDLGQPFVLAGDVEALRGFATFLGRKFNIEKGVVTFTGSEDINPILDISATYQVSDYTISVNVTGESKKPQISYTSTPELDQQDILSLLIFGRTSDRLTGAEQTTLGSKAEQFAGGLAAGMIERTVGKALGLDTVAIEIGDQGSASSVGAGRYVTQDIYVEYKRKLSDPGQGGRTGNAVTVEYTINRGLKIEATGSDYGETAIDFVWSHDY